MHACTHLLGWEVGSGIFCAWIFVGWLSCLFCFVCWLCEVWGGVFWFCCLNYDSWEVWYVLDLSLRASYSHCSQEKKQESRLHFRRWISERARERREEDDEEERFKLLARKRKKNLDIILDGVYKKEREKKEKKSKKREREREKREEEDEEIQIFKFKNFNAGWSRPRRWNCQDWKHQRGRGTSS